MSGTRNPITVFTKPWPKKSVEELAAFVRELGMDGVELPVRPGFQVEPANIARDLPRAARIFQERGVKIVSIAGAADKAMVSACGDAGIPIIRVMAPIDMKKGYRSSVEELQRTFDALLPDLERHNVTWACRITATASWAAPWGSFTSWAATIPAAWRRSWTRPTAAWTANRRRWRWTSPGRCSPW